MNNITFVDYDDEEPSMYQGTEHNWTWWTDLDDTDDADDMSNTEYES